MTPNEIGQILKELGGLKVEVRDLHTDVREIKADGKETKAEVKRTNGRVTAIEKRHDQEDTLSKERASVARARAESRQRWGGWFAPIVSGTIVGLIVLFASLVLTHQI